MSTIMIVEDDKMLNEGISFNLQCDGFNVISAFSLEEANKCFNKNNIDMIILDRNLPDGDGIDFCKAIRAASNVPILFLTAKDTEFDVITGFQFGADDYITKPFSIHILRQRILALFRRYGQIATNKSNVLIVDDFKFDFDKMTVTKDEENIVLAPTEYKLLKKLVQCKGEVVTREELVEQLWDNESEFVEEHALTVNINRLRKKIEDNSSKPQYIKTVYGMGYMWGQK